MKSCFKVPILLVLLAIATRIPAQIKVGELINGEPTLIMSDSELTDTLAFVLNGVTLVNTVAESATDTLGLFYYIKAEGERPNQSVPSKVAVILSLDGNSLLFTNASGCTMECNVNLPCSTCDQVIFEKCKRQRCSCASESGGCSSSITFPD